MTGIAASSCREFLPAAQREASASLLTIPPPRAAAPLPPRARKAPPAPARRGAPPRGRAWAAPSQSSAAAPPCQSSRHSRSQRRSPGPARRSSSQTGSPPALRPITPAGPGGRSVLSGLLGTQGRPWSSSALARNELGQSRDAGER
eukprot:79600-Prorocentrum_minimum.AAC.3